MIWRHEISVESSQLSWSASPPMATGAILGAVIYDAGELEQVVVADALSCIPRGIAFSSLMKWHGHVPPPSAERSRQSLSIVRPQPGVRSIFVVTCICCFMGGYTVTLAAIAGSIHSSAMTLAWMHAASIGGAALVGVGVRRLHFRVSWGRRQQAALVVFSIGVFMIWLMRVARVEHDDLHPMLATVIVVLAVFPIGFALGLDATVLSGLLQSNTPTGSRTSPLSAYTVKPLALVPIGQSVIGRFADVFGVEPALGEIGLTTVAHACIAPRTTLRRAFDLLEDSVEVSGIHN